MQTSHSKSLAHDRQITLELSNLPPDAPLAATCTDIVEVVLRINQVRAAGQVDKLLPVRIVVELQAPELTADERSLLHQAQKTNYRRMPAFTSPGEVRMFFTADAVKAASGTPFTPQTLAAMADVVIKARTNCEF